jgi:hypothetical protein
VKYEMLVVSLLESELFGKWVIDFVGSISPPT